MKKEGAFDLLERLVKSTGVDIHKTALDTIQKN